MDSLSKGDDNLSKVISFDNCQENALDGSSNRAYNLFFRFFWTTSFVGAGLWGFVFVLGVVATIYLKQNISTYFLDFFLFFPFTIIFVVLIICSICIYRPMQKMETIQGKNLIRKKFSFKTFLSVVLIWFILFSGFSLVFDAMSSHPNTTRGCDICGRTVSYENTVNHSVIHRYCYIHAIYFAFLNPIVIISDPPTHGRGFETMFTGNDTFILLGALLSLYTWIFVIGFAFFLGKGYTWRESFKQYSRIS